MMFVFPPVHTWGNSVLKKHNRSDSIWELIVIIKNEFINKFDDA